MEIVMKSFTSTRKTDVKVDMRQFLGMIAVIAIPVALQNLLSTTGSMVDTIMLASLGEKTVGAVGLCAQFSSLLFSCYWGFVGGGMLFFSQYWGAGDHENIRKSYGMTLSFMLIPGIAFAIFAVCFPEVVMNLYTDSKDIQVIGIQYLKIIGFAYPLQVIAMAMSALLRSIERVKIPLAGGIAAVLTNFVCNYILIFGKLGFPALGVRGAAIGTVISSAVNILVIVVLAKAHKAPFLLDFSQHFKWNRKLIKLYLQKCFPIICNELLIGIGNMMINIVLGHQVDEAIAATAVFRTLEGIIISFFSGFSNASSILVGKEVGAGHHELAFARAWRLVYLCSGLIGGVALILILVHQPLLHVMGLSGASFEYATGMLIIYAIICLIRMGNWVQNDTFRAAGDAGFGSIMEITFTFLMVQPAIHLANDYFHAPFLLVFALCYIDEPVRYIIMQRHLYSRKWIRPVSDSGLATIGAFREKYGVKVGKVK